MYAIVSGALVNSFRKESKGSSKPEREALKYEIRNWGPARRVGTPQENIEIAEIQEFRDSGILEL